jgi:hypothetical protein
MNCFHNRNNEIIQPILPQGLDYNTLFPKYKIIKPDNSVRYQLKGTRILVSDRILENEYYNYSRKYPWIKIKCFELIQPKEKYMCIKIINKNTKNPNKIILFSNGETSNMCGILPILIDLSSYLRLNIITYEYPKPNQGQGIFKKEQDMIECTLTIISYVYASPEYKTFILMGYSTGVYINYKIIELLINKSKKFVGKLKNLINISPMWCFDSSYAKKIFHNRKYSNFVSNLIKNTNLKLNVSSFISHGVKDNKIGYMISMNICSRLNFVYQWYPKEGDHYNILLKDIYRRKLFKRLQKFLSVEDLGIGNELDNSIISRITNQGIKVNITKDVNNLNISSGNFFFKNGDDKNGSEGKVNSKRYKIKGNNKNISRKESGFSFLDISIQKHINTNEMENDINEINDEEEFDKDDNEDNKNFAIMNDIYEENDIDEDNDKNINNNINKEIKKDLYGNINDENNNIIEVVSSVVTNEELKNISDDEDEKNDYKKGYLINDSFGFIAPPNKNNDELSFRKDK